MVGDENPRGKKKERERAKINTTDARYDGDITAIFWLKCFLDDRGAH